MNEVLRGIRVVKMYAWECNFTAKIRQLRELELASLKGGHFVCLCFVFLLFSVMVLMALHALGVS